MGKVINKADETEAISEGLARAEVYAGAWPWSHLSGSPMDNPELASILESFGVTPDMIQSLVEQHFDALMVTSAGALKSLQKIAVMMEENELWDFTEFMQLLDEKTDRFDFETHAQDHGIHLSDADVEALASFWDLVSDVEEITGQTLDKLRLLEALITQMQGSIFRQAEDLNLHITSGLHLHEGEREEIVDHINNDGEYKHLLDGEREALLSHADNSGEYRHFTEDQFETFFDKDGEFTGGGADVYSLVFPEGYTTKGDSNVYAVRTYTFLLFSGDLPMGGIDALDISWAELERYGAAPVADGAELNVKIHAENTGASVLLLDETEYPLLRRDEDGSARPLNAGELREGYYYRLEYSAGESAFVVASAASIADSSGYDDDRTAASVSAVHRLEQRVLQLEELVRQLLQEKEGATDAE